MSSLAVIVALLIGQDDPRALEDWVRAAQETNLARWCRGSLHATTIEETVSLTTECQIRLTWVDDGAKAKWDYLIWESSPGGEGKGDSRPVPRHVRSLERRGELWCYDESSRFLDHVADRSRFQSLAVHVLPSQSWLGFLRSNRRWADLLDRRQFPPDKFAWTLERARSDKIVAHRTTLPPGATATLTWDPHAGGNLTAYHAEQPDMVSDATYEWAKHASGVWYPIRYRQIRADPNSGRAREFTAEIHEFDPNPELPPDEFEPDSLKVAPGAFVAESSGGGYRTFRKGSKATVETIPFSELADWARSRGFSSPDRDD